MPGSKSCVSMQLEWFTFFCSLSFSSHTRVTQVTQVNPFLKEKKTLQALTWMWLLWISLCFVSWLTATENLKYGSYCSRTLSLFLYLSHSPFTTLYYSRKNIFFLHPDVTYGVQSQFSPRSSLPTVNLVLIQMSLTAWVFLLFTRSHLKI